MVELTRLGPETQAWNMEKGVGREAEERQQAQEQARALWLPHLPDLSLQ